MEFEIEENQYNNEIIETGIMEYDVKENKDWENSSDNIIDEIYEKIIVI